MKPDSPLSLLLFLQYVSASPLALPKSIPNPHNCHTPSCLSSQPSKPPTKSLPPPSDPHFPSHQLSDLTETPSFNNAPLTPPKTLPATIALTAPQPLSSGYLLSLTNSPPTSASSIQNPSAQEPLLLPPTKTEDYLPSKPTSELPALRSEDAKRYWLESEGRELKREDLILDGPSGMRRIHLCGGARVTYVQMRAQGKNFAREYSDFLVVGIVVLFLGIVIALEAFERAGDIKEIIMGTRRRRGDIYLEDDEEVAFTKGPFRLQPAPGRKPRGVPVQVFTYADSEADTEVGESETEEAGFYYDSDACEKV